MQGTTEELTEKPHARVELLFADKSLVLKTSAVLVLVGRVFKSSPS